MVKLVLVPWRELCVWISTDQLCGSHQNKQAKASNSRGFDVAAAPSLCRAIDPMKRTRGAGATTTTTRPGTVPCCDEHLFATTFCSQSSHYAQLLSAADGPKAKADSATDPRFDLSQRCLEK